MLIGEKADKKKNRRKVKNYVENALITALPVVGFLVFGAFPLIISLIMSFFEMHDTDFSQAVFVGLDNFKNMLDFNVHGKDFLYTFLTVGMYTLSVFIGLVIAVFIAYQLNKIKFLRRLFRTVFFIPAVCSVSVVTIVFKIFLDQNSGVFNEILKSLGFEGVPWLVGSPVLFSISMISVSVWSGLGYSVVLLQAAFANVDQSYAEAAAIDGASAGQIFRKVTFHAITPTLGYLLTIRLISALQQMALYYQFGYGMIGTPMWTDSLYAWNTPVVYLYEMVFKNSYKFGYGIGSAAAWILALVIFIVTRINFRLQKKWVSYDF